MTLLYSLDYQEPLHDFYQNLASLPGFVLLESADRVHGRYDILSAYPYDRLKIGADDLSISESIQAFKSFVAKMPSNNLLPFQGGAIGYISYDFGARLHGILSTPQPSLKGMPLIDLGLYDWAIVVDHKLKKITVFAACNHQDTPEIVEEIILLWHAKGLKSASYSVNSEFQACITQSEYESAFLAIHQDLKRGRCYQVNYTQAYTSSYSGDLWGLYKNIATQNPVPFSAFLRTIDAEVLSFSPERFLLYEDGRILTSPIKGTIKRSHIPEVDEALKNELLMSSKNRAENVMIVDLLRNDLGKIATTGSVKVSHLCALESYNAVHHLVSEIHALCQQSITPAEAFLSCFPGGSITGAPKIEAMNVIHEQERFSRGIYCGSIGYFSHHGRFDTNIAIRTLIARDNKLHLAAGGAIVIDSTCEEEYQECMIKIEAIIRNCFLNRF
jgi:para-aminobenzoate synthetase component I